MKIVEAVKFQSLNQLVSPNNSAFKGNQAKETQAMAQIKREASVEPEVVRNIWKKLLFFLLHRHMTDLNCQVFLVGFFDTLLKHMVKSSDWHQPSDKINIEVVSKWHAESCHKRKSN